MKNVTWWHWVDEKFRYNLSTVDICTKFHGNPPSMSQKNKNVNIMVVLEKKSEDSPHLWSLQYFTATHVIDFEIFQSEPKALILLFNMFCSSSCVLFNTDTEAKRNWAKILLRNQLTRGGEHRVNWLMILLPRIFIFKPLLSLGYCLFCAPNWKSYQVKQRKFQSKGCQCLFTVKESASTLSPLVSNKRWESKCFSFSLLVASESDAHNHSSCSQIHLHKYSLGSTPAKHEKPLVSCM